MTTGNPLAPDLRIWIEAAVENTLSLSQLNGLVDLCHSMASVALRRKIAPAMLNSGVHGTNYRDLAYDCIAELFQQGEDGSLLQIRAYFQGIDRRAASDQELLTHIRRIVFTKVNHGVVRFYGEADPDLGKILRNIKLSVQALRSYNVVERFGDTFLLPAFSPSLEHLPPFTREELESELRGVARIDDHVPAMLAHLSRMLRGQQHHSRLVSLTTVALAIKSIYFVPAAEESVQAASDGFDRAVKDAVDGLPPMYREVVVLHYYSDMSYAQIESALGISGDKIKGRLARARKQIQVRLEKEGFRQEQ